MKILFLPFLLSALLNIQFVQGQLYKLVHKEAIFIDTHNDFMSIGIEKNKSFDQNLKGITQSDLNRMIKGGVDVQVFSIFCDGTYGTGRAFKYANREIDSLYAVVHRNPGKMMIVKSPNDIEQAIKSKKLGNDGCGRWTHDRRSY